MAKGKRLTALISTLLSCAAVFGGLGCLATAMDLSFDPGALLWSVLGMVLVLSLFWDSRLWLLPLGAAALLLGYWWQEGTLRLSIESLLYQISDLYDRGYGWGILQWSDRSLLPQDVTVALLALGLPIGAIFSFSVVKGRYGWLGAGTALIPLLLCVLLTDTVPQELYLALLLGAIILLLMTFHVRSHSHKQANTLTLTLALPLALALALLFVFCPRENYHMQYGAQNLEDFVLQLLDQAEVPEALQDVALVPGDQARTVNLANAGKRSNDGDVVMTLWAEETTTIYLRGCAYDIYDGKSWSSTPGWNAWNSFYAAAPNATTKSLTIRTRQPHSVLYFTYAPQNAPQKVLSGRMRNEENWVEYTISYAAPATYNSTWDTQENEIGGQQLSEYLQLPESTRDAAQKILSRRVGVPTDTTNAGQVWKNAKYIADWVSERASYSLRTDKMPDDRNDFALWFLNESDTGYCTHYATATVVLLRAAGIPAQYVTGYLADTQAGKPVYVTAADAHAWVEIFVNGVGWVVLEPTPAQAISGNVGGQDDPTTPQRPTQPQEAETAPTQQVETSAPTQPGQTQATAGTAETLSGETAFHPTETLTTPMGGADPKVPGSTDNPRLGKALLWLLIGLGSVVAVLAQWRIRVAIGRRKLQTHDRNRRALALWKQLERASRLAKQTPSEEAFWLAQKARFSQHTLTGEELQLLKQALKAAHTTLRSRNFLYQLLYTLVLAIY